MEKACDQQGSANPEAPGDTAETLCAVEFEVLAGIDHIKTGCPEHDGGGEPEDPRIERAAYRNPGGGGRDSQAEAENQVRKQREAFRKRIEENNCKRDRRKDEAQCPELPGSPEKNGRGSDCEAPCETNREQPRGQMPVRGAAVSGIDLSVQNAIKRHGGGACCDHRDDDPKETPLDAGDGEAAIAPRQQRASESERQRENGVLELDHVEREPQPFPKSRHRVDSVPFYRPEAGARTPVASCAGVTRLEVYWTVLPQFAQEYREPDNGAT